MYNVLLSQDFLCTRFQATTARAGISAGGTAKSGSAALTRSTFANNNKEAGASSRRPRQLAPASASSSALRSRHIEPQLIVPGDGGVPDVMAN